MCSQKTKYHVSADIPQVLGVSSRLVSTEKYEIERNFFSLANTMRFLEAAPGVEPGDYGFAIRCLTTWLCRRLMVKIRPLFSQYKKFNALTFV